MYRTSNIKHVVERRRATENLSSRPVETSTFNTKTWSFLRYRFVLPVNGRLLNEKDALRNVGDGTLTSTRFQQKNFYIWIFWKTIRNDTTCRASAHYYVVVHLWMSVKLVKNKKLATRFEKQVVCLVNCQLEFGFTVSFCARFRRPLNCLKSAYL